MVKNLQLFWGYQVEVELVYIGHAKSELSIEPSEVNNVCDCNKKTMAIFIVQPTPAEALKLRVAR